MNLAIEAGMELANEVLEAAKLGPRGPVRPAPVP